MSGVPVKGSGGFMTRGKKTWDTKLSFPGSLVSSSVLPCSRQVFTRSGTCSQIEHSCEQIKLPVCINYPSAGILL